VDCGSPIAIRIVNNPDCGHVCAEALIHLWYSAFVTAELESSLRMRVLPFIVEVCDKTKSEMPHTMISETWNFAFGRTMRLVLRSPVIGVLRNTGKSFARSGLWRQSRNCTRTRES
jgi:hypothetical protein